MRTVINDMNTLMQAMHTLLFLSRANFVIAILLLATSGVSLWVGVRLRRMQREQSRIFGDFVAAHKRVAEIQDRRIGLIEEAMGLRTTTSTTPAPETLQ